MKVLLFVHGWPPEAAGGTGLVVGALAEALAARGHAVTVAHPGPPAETRWRGVRVVGVGIRRGLGWVAGWSAGVAEVEALLAAVAPEVVDIHHLSGWPLSLPSIARNHAARVIVTLHDYAIPCARGQLVDHSGSPCSGPDVQRCTRCLAPFLGLRARALGWPTRKEHRTVQRRLHLARQALAAADRLLAPSRDLAQRIERMGAGPVQVCPLPATVDIRPAPPPPHGPVRLLFCSSLIPTKGPHLLVEAFARLPAGRATLTLAGARPHFPADPGFAARLKARVSGLPGARLRGSVAHAQVPDLLHAHDVLVLPSVWRENSPLIVREACAAGLRTIVSDRGGARELDPHARLVDTLGDGAVDRLLAALVAECHQGRGRRTPVRWPTAESCANWLTTSVYRPAPGPMGLRTD